MIKKYRWTLIAACAVTVCPVIVGLVLWNRLPEEIATHFGSDNVANGWSSKPFAVFGIPLILGALELFLFFVTTNDPKRKNIDEKIMRMILWIIPVVSLICCLSCYGIALGMAVDIGLIINIGIGILFVIIGNYMHRIKQNYTVGIRLPWTLNSQENWNRTHRMAAWLFILGGIVFMINGFLQKEWMVGVVLLIVFIPGIYSYILYRRGI